MGVRTAAQVVQDPHPGRADRHVREPGAPRPPEGVGHDDAHLDGQQLAQTGTDRGGRGVGVRGQQQHRARLGVRGVDAGRRHDQPLPVLDDPQRAPARDDPYRLRVYDVLAGVGADDPALRLGDDLRGDQQDVPVPQLRPGRSDEPREVVAGADLRDPGDGAHLVRGNGGNGRETHREASASSSAARAIAAVAARSVIISGTARLAIPAASTAATASASAVSTSQPSSRSLP